MAPLTLHIGLLLFHEFQWLDAAGPVDYLHNHSHSMISRIGVAQSVVDKAPIIHWYYISSDLTPVQASSGPPQLPTHTYDDCPDLDYIIVPGPDPTVPLPKGCATFLQKRFAETKLKAILTVCTGSMAIAQAGILDGYHVCSNKWMLRIMAGAGGLNKKVTWIGDKRWHIDRKVWSAAGVTAGIDLAAEFARQHFAPEIVEVAKDISEYESNPAQPDPFARLLEGVDLA
ncbi:hypothetical protein GALMADRAFT_254564 [Galerina marginata CBS 339.88]|uniref:DJ-1/PfpI domain-containing protein n=1 Tax=Galerina marginata (strain CBS 339.88) TaxID=685588 RepID=A0A067SJA9_GALM3|nr:hypothetical protein GALMADRAFT_254564 [Galerina marginata CBS 339.88]